MNLPRVLNSIADNYTALRLAGFTPDESEGIVMRAFRDCLDTLYPQRPPKPYPLTPRQEQEIHNEYTRYHGDPRRNQ